MDRVDHGFRLGILDRFQGRVRSLSKHARKLATVEVALILASLLLGKWAQSAAAREALLAWERENPPSPALWEGVLRARGFVELASPEERARAARALPVLSDGPGTAWISADLTTIALDPAGEPGSAEARIFKRLAPEAPGRSRMRSALDPKWQPLGASWVALQNAAGRALPEFPLPKRVTRRETGDPRAIEY